MSGSTPICANCKKTAAALNLTSLSACANCRSTRYCSRDCQKADWRTHKQVCGLRPSGTFMGIQQSNTYSSPRLKDLEKHVAIPFTKLDQGKYLHDRPEKDAYKLLIDSFRMREADNLNLEGKTTPGASTRALRQASNHSANISPEQPRDLICCRHGGTLRSKRSARSLVRAVCGMIFAARSVSRR